MNPMRDATLGLAMVIGGWSCSAQQSAIPFEKIEKDAQLSAMLTVPGNDTSNNPESNSLSAGMASSGSSSGGFTRVAPHITTRRTLTPSFYLFNGLHLGVAVFDVEMTQQCIASHKCREGNPLMPSSRAGALSLNLALVGYGTFVSYKLRKHESKLWWLSPAIGTASHGVGAATGIAHQ